MRLKARFRIHKHVIGSSIIIIRGAERKALLHPCASTVFIFSYFSLLIMAPRTQSSLSARFEASADWAKEIEKRLSKQIINVWGPLARSLSLSVTLCCCQSVQVFRRKSFPSLEKQRRIFLLRSPTSHSLCLWTRIERGPYFFVWRNLSFEVRSRCVGTGIIWADALNASLLSKKLHFGSARVTKPRMFERPCNI